MVGIGRCQFQCDWAGKFVQALQQRGGSEEACKVLALPAAQFNQYRLLLEQEEVQGLRLIKLPIVQRELQGYADRYIRDAGGSVRELVNIVDDPIPNAFATGQTVFLHSGIVDWYLRPDVALMNLGLSRSQANQYLSQVQADYPGQIGLFAILAHETGHNVLGHPDVHPAAERCNEFISAGVKRVKTYEEELATGRQPSHMKEFLKGIVVGYAQTFLGSQRQQQIESEADAFGAWLVWKETGEAEAMAMSLQWLADFPGTQPANQSGAVFEALCSDHPNLLQRVSAAQSLASSLMNSEGLPQDKIRNSPLPETTNQYEDFLEWYPKQVEAINRIAEGKLTAEESQTNMTIHIETQPNGATLSIDGNSVGNAPADRSLSLGPHQISAMKDDLRAQVRIVVFSDAPKKIKLDLRK